MNVLEIVTTKVEIELLKAYTTGLKGGDFHSRNVAEKIVNDIAVDLIAENAVANDLPDVLENRKDFE